MSVHSRLIALLIGAVPICQAHSAAGWITGAEPMTVLNQQPSTGVGAEMVFVELSGAANPSGCPTANSYYFIIDTDRRKRIFAMLLRAHMTSRPVQLYVTGACHPQWGSALIDGAVIQ
jgi:hypothetical protein